MSRTVAPPPCVQGVPLIPRFPSVVEGCPLGHPTQCVPERRGSAGTRDSGRPPTAPVEPVDVDADIVTTEEKLEGFNIVRAIAVSEVGPE